MHTELQLKLINRHDHTNTSSACYCVAANQSAQQTPGHHGSSLSGWQNRGNRKGFPFSPVTTAVSRGFPSTFPWHGQRASPILLSCANWSAVNPPEHVAALITVPHSPRLRKTTKWGYMAVRFQGATRPMRSTVSLLRVEKCVQLLMICDLQTSKITNPPSKEVKYGESDIYTAPKSASCSQTEGRFPTWQMVTVRQSVERKSWA